MFGDGVFVAVTAAIVGDVELGDGVNVWYGAVLRGDVESIRVGAGSSIQDNVAVHGDPAFPTTIGTGCIVGHLAMVHGARVGDRCLIGMSSTLLNGCEIGADSIVGAGSLVTQGKRFPPRSLIMGTPARVVRELRDEDLEERAVFAQRYARRAQVYLAQGLGTDLSVCR